MSIYDTLNREQQQAVCQTEGPVLILAGAGSGKTRVITHRIAYLMEECEVNPWNILAITFTNKAAGEMRERVDRLIGFGSESVWISTFHSMCVRILRRHIDLLGYQNSFTIYDTDDQKTVMKGICKRLQIDTKQMPERAFLSAISFFKSFNGLTMVINPKAHKTKVNINITPCFHVKSNCLNRYFSNSTKSLTQLSGRQILPSSRTFPISLTKN